MKGITKSVAVVGQVIALLVGNKFTTPITFVTDKYIDLTLF